MHRSCHPEVQVPVNQKLELKGYRVRVNMFRRRDSRNSAVLLLLQVKHPSADDLRENKFFAHVYAADYVAAWSILGGDANDSILDNVAKAINEEACVARLNPLAMHICMIILFNN